MLKRLGAVLSSLLTASTLSNAQSISPPLDLNKLVENPNLVAAMERVARENSDSAKDKLLQELQHAHYIAAMFDDGLMTREKAPGQIVISKGSTFGVLTASKDGKNYLVLFTDWRALREYTQSEVSGWILPAKDAWQFALQGSTYDGAVVNPAHNALPLARPMIEFLSKDHVRQ